MANKTPEAKSEAPTAAEGQSETDKLKAEAAKYGVAYALFSDAFKTPGVDRLTRVVSWALAGFAVFVVLYAVWSSI